MFIEEQGVEAQREPLQHTTENASRQQKQLRTIPKGCSKVALSPTISIQNRYNSEGQQLTDFLIT